MTIDEAQIMLKAKAKCIERICKGIYEDCNEQKCDNCDLCYAQGTNGEQIELMLQCAEWLEELKAIKSDGFTDNLLDMGFTKGYNKAIDDFVRFVNTMPTVETEDGTIRPMRLEEMAEQLKKQKKTCFDCKNHFMSDCYLECYKHERINNDSICDDFE